ncbi:hypothetical protein CHCC20333_1671 [Bacillus paralicheniformis]|nr:hypothetical protein CHCC20333_1671 [Bacillus paralicheniformis]
MNSKFEGGDHMASIRMPDHAASHAKPVIGKGDTLHGEDK